MNRDFLSRVFLYYFYVLFPRFAILRPVFACSDGQQRILALSLSTICGSPRSPLHRLWYLLCLRIGAPLTRILKLVFPLMYCFRLRVTVVVSTVGGRMAPSSSDT